MSTPKLENTLYAYFNKLSTSILMGGYLSDFYSCWQDFNWVL